MAFDPESIDLEDIVQALRQAFGARIEGEVVGRTRLRDAVVDKLHCSELEAEQIVDTLIARGFVVRREAPDQPVLWELGG